MALSLIQNTYAVRPSIQASFLGSGGDEPYTYSVDAGGAGGTINPTTGRYTAPALTSSDPLRFFDTVRCTDYSGAEATGRILVGSPLALVMDILQREMVLPNGRVYLYNQKVLQPADSALYIAVRVEDSRSFGNTNRSKQNGSSMQTEAAIAMVDTIGFDLISRSTEALDRRAEFLRVWNSVYCIFQQNLNAFAIGRDPSRGFMMIPDLDGAAIPYRFRINYQLMYREKAVTPVAFYDSFDPPEISTDA